MSPPDFYFDFFFGKIRSETSSSDIICFANKERKGEKNGKILQ